MKLRWLAWSVALGLAFAASYAAASLVSTANGPREPRAPAATQVEQSASAVDQGIRITALGATFSGTATFVELKIDVVDPSGSGGVPAGVEVARLVPAPDGFQPTWFAGHVLSAHVTRDGTVVARLPALAGESAPNPLTLRIVALHGQSPAGMVRVTGDWPLTLALPADLGASLRVEELRAEQVVVAGIELRVDGVRSTTETLINVATSEEILLLGQPVVRDSQDAHPAREIAPTAQGLALNFAPTRFGDPLVLALGPVGLRDGPGATAFKIDLGRALSRPRAVDGTFAVEASDIVSGDSALVLSGDSGTDYIGPWVSVLFRGNWQSSDVAIYDEDGIPMRRGRFITQFAKNEGGQVIPGKTEIAVRVSDLDKAGVVTFVLGRATGIADAPELGLVVAAR